MYMYVHVCGVTAMIVVSYVYMCLVEIILTLVVMNSIKIKSFV